MCQEESANKSVLRRVGQEECAKKSGPRRVCQEECARKSVPRRVGQEECAKIPTDICNNLISKYPKGLEQGLKHQAPAGFPKRIGYFLSGSFHIFLNRTLIER